MKKIKWIYWIATILLFIQLVFTGVADFLLPEQMVTTLSQLGVPLYLMPFLGVLKILGAVTIIFVRNQHLKIGAYAGVLFYGSGIVYVHIVSGDPFTATFPGLLFIIFNLVSYFTWIKLTVLQPQTTLS